MARPEVFNREEVLVKARDLFWDKGFNGTSMNDLVETTGLNRSSLYNSFGNKMAIYKTVLIKYQEDSQDIFQNAIQRASNPRDAIQFIFENFISEIIKDTKGKGCFSLNCKAELSRSNLSIKEYLDKMQELSIELFRELIQEGQELGLINKSESAEDYAYYLFSSFQGLRMTGILTRNRDRLEHIVGNTLQVLR